MPKQTGNVTRHIIAIDYENDVFITEDKETLNFDGWDLTNGNHIWTAEPLVCEWDTLRRDTLYCIRQPLRSRLRRHSLLL